MAASESDLRKFLADVADIAKMPATHPDSIVSALRAFRDDFDRFSEWAQSYLDSGRWGGHSLLDAIKQETIERDKVVAAIDPWRGFWCAFCDKRTKHADDCVWLRARQAVGEEVTHG